MDKEIQQYINHINQKFATRYSTVAPDRQEYYDFVTSEFIQSTKAVKGKVYIKIVKDSSVYSFIVAENTGKFKRGDILKAVSWKAPAKNFIRGNIFDEASYTNVSWTGA